MNFDMIFEKFFENDSKSKNGRDKVFKSFFKLKFDLKKYGINL
jgi:hypothetical protein